MWTGLWRHSAWNIQSYSLGKIWKIFKNVICWIFYPACLASVRNLQLTPCPSWAKFDRGKLVFLVGCHPEQLEIQDSKRFCPYHNIKQLSLHFLHFLIMRETKILYALEWQTHRQNNTYLFPYPYPTLLKCCFHWIYLLNNYGIITMAWYVLFLFFVCYVLK